MNLLAARLDALRGSSPPVPHTAKTLAALTVNPECDRRALLDAAGVDKDALAAHLNLPRPLCTSAIALDHGAAFERRVTTQAGAELVQLLRETLDLTLPEVSYEDVNAVGGREPSSLPLRHSHTRNLILGAARDKTRARTLLDHPVLRLTVAGHPVYLEPDIVAFQHHETFHIVEIESFPVIDGQADPAKVAAALTQAAAYVLALRELLAEGGLPPERVSNRVVLVNPRDFSHRPTATLADAAQKIKSLSWHLGRLRRLPDLLDQLPPSTTFDLAPDREANPTRPREELAAALSAPRAHYSPGCLHHCELAHFCRNEARHQGRTEVLGTTVRDDVAGIDDIALALALTDGHQHPSRDRSDITQALRHAQRVHADFLAGTT
ncbi:hypothetical protein [Streptomyces sp. XD-27]|uniref:hypothetical protein n=1 Tax=Streptomyces sp. XD-27 TaxID=3062779 RepID=UPI0026F44DFB|nr:hypothetical protein [Streptomyces sp. XD-27]WKX68602.1 hypothetical protein Q3Y56_00300 [Streptomyces sp. XD-27]